MLYGIGIKNISTMSGCLNKFYQMHKKEKKPLDFKIALNELCWLESHIQKYKQYPDIIQMK